MALELKDNFVGIIENIEAPLYSTVNYDAQTFTATSSYNLASVKVMISRLNTPCIVVLSIRNTNPDGTPFGVVPPDTSGNLVSKSLSSENLPGDFSYSLVEFVFDSPLQLTEGNVYAIVLWVSDAVEDNYQKGIKWRGDFSLSSDPYTGGSMYGINWFASLFSKYDLYFECYANENEIVEAEGIFDYE